MLRPWTLRIVLHRSGATDLHRSGATASHPSGATGLHLQSARAIIAEIIRGRLAPAAALPGTR